MTKPWPILTASCLLLSAVPLLPACGSDELAKIPPFGAVDGFVCDPVHDVLAVGARMTGDGIDGLVSVTTDATGYFRLPELRTGEQSLRLLGTHAASGEQYADTVPATVVEGVTTRIADPACLTLGSGSIVGRICASESGLGSGEGFYLAGARVLIDTGAQVYETFTGGDGRFELASVPVGPHTLRIEKGSFSATLAIEVVADQVTQVDQVCVEPDAKLAVVSGIFDSMETVLQGIGFDVGECLGTTGCGQSTVPDGEMTLIEGTSSYYVDSLLLDSVRLASFDIVFFNCGLADAFLSSAPPEAAENLRAFVNAGGSIYVSDWAYEILRVAFPGLIDFFGDDGTAMAARVGVAAPSLAATITDPDLAALLGSATANLVYDKSAWTPMTVTQGQQVRVMVTGTARIDGNGDEVVDSTLNAAPLLISVPYGAGRIVFTTFHTHAQANADMTAILRHMIFEL